MYRFSELKLAGLPRCVRFFYYIVSGFRLKSFSSWKADGEPNPFVAKTYRHRPTEMKEFVDIFDDYRSS